MAQALAFWSRDRADAGLLNNRSRHIASLLLTSAVRVQEAPDITSRLVASELSKNMGQLVVVDNRAGAGGIRGYEAIAKATPDGYIFCNATFSFITHPLVSAKLPFDTLKDFRPVALGPRTLRS